MNKRAKILKNVILILTISVILTIVVKNSVYSSSFVFNVNATKTKLKPTEETEVVMKISDIVDVNDLGINALEAVLEYDTNVLEVVTVNDMEGKNNWTITYNQEAGNFLVHNMASGIKETQEIGRIKFKVKDNVAKKTKTIIKFKNVKSNDGKNLMYEGDKQVELIIDWDEQTKTEDDKKLPTIPTIDEKKNVAKGSIPQTGEEIGIVIVMLTIGLIAIISYIRYKKIKLK